MAYQAGSATTAADLLSALQTFCTSNGWTLSGSVLSKGGCFTRITVSGDGLAVLGGTGIDASNNLTGAGPATVSFNSPAGNLPLVYPVAYFFHAFGNEVYAVLNWSIDAYTLLGFGCSPAPGLPGTGGWYSGSYGGGRAGTLAWTSWADFYQGVAVDYNGYNGTGFFWVPGYASGGNAYVHHGLDGHTWTDVTGGNNQLPSLAAKAAGFAGPLMQQGINVWNGQAPLIPVNVYIDRGSSKTSIIATIQHARYINMGNLASGEILTLGSDRWRVYPFFRKGAGYGPGGLDTGWMALAVRYDGP